MRFILAESGPIWREWQSFGEACEAARLSRLQAEAARLAASFLTYGEIADVLSGMLGISVKYQSARERTLEAERRLKRTLPHLVLAQRREARALLDSVRNVRSHNPNVAIYRERMGVSDREPVRFASRLLGECAEDLTERPLRFLKDLPSLLDRFTSRAVR